jgi:hypothetical protein
MITRDTWWFVKDMITYISAGFSLKAQSDSQTAKVYLGVYVKNTLAV